MWVSTSFGKMSSWSQSDIKHRQVLMLYNFQRYSIQSQSFPQNPPPTPPLSSNAETSPAMLFLIVILAIIFFISGLLHLLARFIRRRRPSSSDFPSNQHPDMSNSGTFQRQLHHLFNIHDSGLDQEFIDSLPLFQYKEILGLKEPFDCAVCLCEFSEQDKLRLLPLCSHAFHVECIDKWLLSNSTCPLCRGALYTPGLDTENPVFDVKDWREESCGINIRHKPNEAEIVFEKTKKVFPVVLGKFRSSIDEGNKDDGESSSNNLDVRRCFSMGSYQYVVAESELQVALSSNLTEDNADPRTFKSSVDGDVKGKTISAVSKNESFSVSKIWLWSKKDRFCGSSNTNIGDHTSVTRVDMRLPWNNVDQVR